MRAIECGNDSISVLNSVLLPEREYRHSYGNFREVGAAIENKVIAGAGSTLYAIALAFKLTVNRNRSLPFEKLIETMNFVADYFEKITEKRSLYSDLFAKIRSLLGEERDADKLFSKVTAICEDIKKQQFEIADKISHNGASFVNDGDKILVFSSSGSSLSSGGGGLLTSIFDKAKRDGKKFEIVCLESRPDLSGSRIMAWDLVNNGHTVSIAPDIQSGYLMKTGAVNKLFLCGELFYNDGALKGQCGVAMIAESASYNNVELLTVCPSYYCENEASPDAIERNLAAINEVAMVRSTVTVPEGITIQNYASEIAPANLLSRIISDIGVFDTTEAAIEKLF